MQDSLRDLDIQIGQNLKRFRKYRNISQSRLAEALGITFQQIQKYETGTNRISASRLVAIGRFLDTNILDFLAANDASTPAGEPLFDEEALKLIALFKAIPQPAVRKAILTLIRDFAQPQPKTQRRTKHL
jgi:transcriptional regulator with XRE-family HTH domain